MKGDDTWTEGLIGMQTDFVYFIPQSHKIRKGGGFVLRLPEQGGGVEGAHEQDAVLLHEDVRSHFGVPFALQVTEVRTGFQ